MLRALELGVRKPLQLRYERLPRTQSEEIRLLFLSDLHLAACRAQSLIRQILTAVEGPAPDLIVLGGDLIDSKRSSADLSSLLHSLRACAPCAAVPGNHDRAYGLPALSALVRECAVHWLPDGPLSLQIRGRRVHLLETAKQLACLEADGATSEMPPTNILCLHNPAEVALHDLTHIKLALAGHLHGSQVVLWQRGQRLYPGALFYRWNGLRFSLGNCELVVSRGLADTLPIRWNCPRELVLCLL